MSPSPRQPIDRGIQCRDEWIELIATEPASVWDIVVVGGGSTGAGIALDAATRGYSVLLLEGADFGKGTSSRSTKLIHGGVRYLQQMQWKMVRESLLERSLLLQNASHLVRELEFIIPCRSLRERIYYGAGLKLYDALAFGSDTPPSHQVSSTELYRRMPQLRDGSFAGGVAYRDAQFDDARLLIDIVKTAIQYGAAALNYAPVTQLLKKADGSVCGVTFEDTEKNKSYDVFARCVVNATGPFCDALRSKDIPHQTPLVQASQGVHLVLSKSYFASESAVIVPKTSDGRVLFIIPWKDRVLVGTTDTPIPSAPTEPLPFPHEVEFLLKTLEEYCGRKPAPSECLSVFCGVRPLVKGNTAQSTKRLSRDHTIETSASGLVTITGGKWTTYRHMAEDCVNHIVRRFDLPPSQSPTRTIPLSLHPPPEPHQSSIEVSAEKDDFHHGMKNLPSDFHSPKIPISAEQIQNAVRVEFARTVEDVLARRTRVLFLDAKQAIAMATPVAKLLAKELGKSHEWEINQIHTFERLAQGYEPHRYLLGDKTVSGNNLPLP